MILVIEYLPVMMTAVMVFVGSTLMILPFSYGLLIFYKFSNLLNKPIFGSKDLLLRVLDLFTFIFLGVFLLLLWTILDVASFMLKLFDRRIIYINNLEQEYYENINQKMDGIEKEKALANGNPAKSMFSENNDMLNKVKNINKALSPIKEGLSDNTLKIFKACLKVVKDHHFKLLGKMDKDEFKYIPTICVLFEMKEMFMITEQINRVLFGVTYIKKVAFIQSQKFQDIVDCILEFEKRELRIDAEDDDESSSDEEEDSQTQHLNKGAQRRNEIELETKLYLTKSNEKWILDQYNLCKKFLIQNSIQGDYDEFYHPVYENFEHIKGLK